MTVHANEHLLREVLGAIAVADRPLDEVHHAAFVSLDELLEPARLPGQVALDQLVVAEPLGRDLLGLGLADGICAHRAPRLTSSNAMLATSD